MSSGLITLPEALGHLLAVLAEDHALVDEAHERLLGARRRRCRRGTCARSASRGDAAPRARRRRRRGRRASSTRCFLARRRLLVVRRIQEAQVVPAGAGPLRHRVRLALRRAAALGAGRVRPIRGWWPGAIRPCRKACSSSTSGSMRGSSDSGTGTMPSLRAVHEGDGLAPVPLPGEDPVAQLVIDGPLADALALQPLDDPELGSSRSSAR